MNGRTILENILDKWLVKQWKDTNERIPMKGYQWKIKTIQWKYIYRVSHKHWDCKHDLKLFNFVSKFKVFCVEDGL